MDRLSPHLLLSIEERIALSQAIHDLGGCHTRRAAQKKERSLPPTGKHTMIIFSLSVISLLTTHALWTNTGY